LDSFEKIDFASFVPLQLLHILKVNNPVHLSLLNGMKGILIGGAAVGAELEKELQKINSPVYSSYGMTETVSHIALRRLNGSSKQSFYTLLPAIDIRTDERNCLALKGAVTNGYWMQTNDIVELLNDTKFNWIGRYDSLINTGGIKVSPEKVEQALEPILADNGIHRYAVIGLPHPSLGEAVTLFLEGNKETQLIERSRTKLQDSISKYEFPKAMIFVDTLPATTSEKIDRYRLKENYKTYYQKQHP
jgi:o-succinylbenzoate---CoA ligase